MKTYRVNGHIVNDMTLQSIRESEVWKQYTGSYQEGITSSPIFSEEEVQLTGIGRKKLFDINDYGFLQILFASTKIGTTGDAIIDIYDENDEIVVTRYINYGSAFRNIESHYLEMWTSVKPGYSVWTNMAGAATQHVRCMYRLHNATYDEEDSGVSDDKPQIAKYLGSITNNIGMEKMVKNDDGNWEWGLHTNSSELNVLQGPVEIYQENKETGKYEYTFKRDGYAEIQASAVGLMEFTANVKLTLRDENGNELKTSITSKQHYFLTPTGYNATCMMNTEVKKGWSISLSVISVSLGAKSLNVFSYPSYKEF